VRVLKVKLELQSEGDRVPLGLFDMESVPPMGENYQLPDGRKLQVVAVVHTPFIRDYDALVVLRKAS
jgi:hypothetical protein